MKCLPLIILKLHSNVGQIVKIIDFKFSLIFLGDFWRDIVDFHHGGKSFKGMWINVFPCCVLQKRADEAFKGIPPYHKLVIFSPPMVIRTIEMGAWNFFLQPPEERLMSNVHAKGNLGLLAVPPEVPFAYKYSNNESFVEVAQFIDLIIRHRPSCFTVMFLVEHYCIVLFHRQVSRGTFHGRWTCWETSKTAQREGMKFFFDGSFAFAEKNL